MKTLIVDDGPAPWSGLHALLALAALRTSQPFTSPLHLHPAQEDFLKELSMQPPTSVLIPFVQSMEPDLEIPRIESTQYTTPGTRSRSTRARSYGHPDQHNNEQANRGAAATRRKQKRKATLRMKRRQRAVR